MGTIVPPGQFALELLAFGTLSPPAGIQGFVQKLQFSFAGAGSQHWDLHSLPFRYDEGPTPGNVFFPNCIRLSPSGLVDVLQNSFLGVFIMIGTFDYLIL